MGPLQNEKFCNDPPWFEVDIYYYGGRRNGHRLLWPNDGLLFVTDDHYETGWTIVDKVDKQNCKKVVLHLVGIKSMVMGMRINGIIKSSEIGHQAASAVRQTGNSGGLILLS